MPSPWICVPLHRLLSGLTARDFSTIYGFTGDRSRGEIAILLTVSRGELAGTFEYTAGRMSLTVPILLCEMWLELCSGLGSSQLC